MAKKIDFDSAIKKQTDAAKAKMAARRGISVEQLDARTTKVLKAAADKVTESLAINELKPKSKFVVSSEQDAVALPKDVKEAAKDKHTAAKAAATDIPFKDKPGVRTPPPKRASALQETDAVSAMMEEDADTNTKDAQESKAVLKRVSAMVQLQRDAELRLAKAEQQVRDEKAKVFKIASIDMPELLREAGLTEVTLEDGTKVEMKDDIQTSITVENRPLAHKWLRDHGFGALIKTEVVVSFGKDELDKADKLTEQLTKKFGPEAVVQDEKVHPQTLKAFVKERIEAGVKKDVPPTKPFSIVPYSFAKLTTKKLKGAM